MLEETGIVKSIDGVIAKVSVPKKSACEGCTAGTCKPEQQTMEIEAFNKAGARPGQKVRVSIQAYTYMKGTMLVYGIPAVMLVIGAVIGKEIMSKIFAGADPDVLSALFGLGAFVVSLIIIKLITSRKEKTSEARPVVEEILD